MLDWVNTNRQDVTWLRGPDHEGKYEWDYTLPNQGEIINLINDYDPEWEQRRAVTKISPRQLRLGLLRDGVNLTNIETIINSLPEPHKSAAIVEWEYALEYLITDGLVKQLAAQLGYDQGELEDLWYRASKL